MRCQPLIRRESSSDSANSSTRMRPFAKAHQALATCLRAGNDRRNSIPASHPFETKGGKKTKPLQVKERNSLKAKFSAAYSEVIRYVNAHG